MHPAHEQERFMSLWTSAQPAVANYIHALIRNPADAKDVLQETALVLFRRFSEYDESRPFLGWALGIARFQTLGHFRDQSRSPIVFDEIVLDRFTQNWCEMAPQNSDRAIYLQSCLERLAPRAKQIVTLRYLENFSAEEIAKRLSAQGSAIRVALQRIRAQLHHCVTQQLQTQENMP